MIKPNLNSTCKSLSVHDQHLTIKRHQSCFGFSYTLAIKALNILPGSF